ncbi:M48 family metallopeptidase [Alteribacter keqinensis]|uniref:M48 family peptidase n=1 Tax=Alteribacter keqinensis TaxID=2483800 RepID=A0A3M7TT56_9BACI|nr:SprT family zinc-dependent metalloprotease [Alteribacter keqinensis]RNA68806.1 M48 family peptidase [Alteribacter keqinensis]
MPSFTYGTTTFDYNLEPKTKSNEVNISVEWLDGIKVTAPPEMNQEQLNELLYKKAPWILEKWKAFKDIERKPAPKEFVSGEKLSYLGRNYSLKVIAGETEHVKLKFRNGRFISIIPTNISKEEKKCDLYNAFKKWYFTHGDKKIKERAEIYTKKMDVFPSKIRLKEQKMRWGTCTPKGDIYLNWRIIMAPMAIVDYLLVHELAHIKHPNHSKEFWQLVRSVLPDYEERKEWLRINGPTLTIEY